MLVLVLNAGSSSLKYTLFDMPDDAQTTNAPPKVLALGLVERVGEPMGRIKQECLPGEKNCTVHEEELPVPDHSQALKLVMERLASGESAVLDSISQIGGVGHRVVHGGEAFSGSILIKEEVLAEIKANAPLAPLHNPAGLAGIEGAQEVLPGKPMVAVFDTAFHQGMPPHVYLYALPMAFYHELKVRRYGFHGTSHCFVSRACSEEMGKPFEQFRAVTAHLGNGCSMAAVKDGRGVDTSMGLTPLAGMIMGTRCGDVDPAVHSFLAKHKGLSLEEIDSVMNKESGLKGICGKNDMRDIHKMRESGGEDAEIAELAFDMFAYRIKQYFGKYLAVLGECDALIFTGGIGENDPDVRERSLDTLAPLGAVLDVQRNREAPRGRIWRISTDDSRIAIYIVPTNEELEIAMQTRAVLKESTGDPA